MGRRVDQGRPGGGLAEAHAAPRLPGYTSPLGSGADVFMDRSEQEDEQGLREAVPQTSEAFIYVAMSRLMVRRLARS